MMKIKNTDFMRTSVFAARIEGNTGDMICTFNVYRVPFSFFVLIYERVFIYPHHVAYFIVDEKKH